MDFETAFWVAHLPALAGWAALLVRPNDARAVRFARGAATLIAVGYLIIFIVSFPAAGVLLRDYSFNGIGSFFADPRLLLLGWVHYLAFDLWVGSWEAEEAARVGMPTWSLVPSLLLTLMLGPLGLLLFMTSRAAHARPAHSENSAIAS